MNTPDSVAIDVEAELEWLKDYKAKKGLSWTQLGQLSNISPGSLSALYTPNYPGKKDNQAKRIFQFRQKVESQEHRKQFVLERPRWIETPTARRVQFLLEVAHMGRITVGAMAPGTGKSMTARHYKDSIGDSVFLVTMLDSTSSTAGMVRQVMQAMGLAVRASWTQQMSALVIDNLMHRKCLLIVDEANFLSLKALEELRGWHDATGVGICLLGNEELLHRIRGRDTNDRHAYARLNSRIANSHVADSPRRDDVEAYLDYYDLIEPDMREPLIERGLAPGHGGLREVQQILEAANMLAIGDDEVLSAKHITDAIRSRATVQMRRAA